jgi:hypothetical protein
MLMLVMVMAIRLMFDVVDHLHYVHGLYVMSLNRLMVW